MSRGIRNNNPGNIRHGIDWDGLDKDQSKDEEFSQFSTPEYGIRAMFKILKTYNDKYNLNTIEGIINRWAPPIENDTEAYINFVSSKVGKNSLATDRLVKLKVVDQGYVRVLVKVTVIVQEVWV